ncbi:unnamed protein product, partial [Ectocarpus sp. 4 AP-2014]
RTGASRTLACSSRCLGRPRPSVGKEFAIGFKGVSFKRACDQRAKLSGFMHSSVESGTARRKFCIVSARGAKYSCGGYPVTTGARSRQTLHTTFKTDLSRAQQGIQHRCLSFNYDLCF